MTVRLGATSWKAKVYSDRTKLARWIDEAIKSLPEGRGHESKSQFLITSRLLSQSPDSAIKTKLAVKRLLSIAHENMHSLKQT